MKAFCLENTRLDRVLQHPLIGNMYTIDKKEADDMLKACHEYLKSIGLGDICHEFVVKEVDDQTMQQLQKTHHQA